MKLKNEICQLILCIWLIPSITLADGLFPTMSQMFGTAMPSIGLAIQRNADERLTADGSTSEKYNGFGEEEYLSFGRYLAGAGAVLDDYSVEGTVMTATISARGASITLSYDWVRKTITAIYPEGTKVEIEKEAVMEADSILPPVGGILPSAEFAVNRKPTSTEETDDGISQVYESFTDEDYTAFNAYLGETGAALQSSSLERGVLNSEVSLDGFLFSLVYDWNRQVLQVNYPERTKPETKKWNALCDGGPVLPDVTALGKELPSISQGILREPDTVKELSDGGKEEVYTEFEEADYEAFSRYLQTAGCTVKEYHVDIDGALVISLENGSGEFQFTYNQMEHTGTAVYPGVQRIEEAWMPKNKSINQGLTLSDFSLHSGVSFGMSRNEVKRIESENGFEAIEKDLEYTYYDFDGEYRGQNCKGLYIYGSMAGISGSRLYYYFDEKDHLFGAVYKFGDHDLNAFADIDNLVMTKYSSLKSNDDRTMPSILDIYYEDITNATFDLDTYDRLQFELSDGARIQIEHALFYSEIKGYPKFLNIEFGGHHYLEYHYSSSKELEDISIALGKKQSIEEEQRQKEEEERANQRSNDI